jgi:hypothetical protein
MENKVTPSDIQLKFMTVVSIMPVLADFLEDLNEEKFFKTDVKMVTQNLIAQVRKLDERVMKNADINAIEEQILIQREFRQWLNN